MSTSEDRTSSPPGGPEDFLGYLLSRAAGVVRGRTDATVRELGLTSHALGFLLLLRAQPESSQSAVASRLGMDRTTMSQLVESQVREGLVSRVPDSADRRNNRLSLTDAGHSILMEASARAFAVERTLTAGLSEVEVKTLRAFLEAMLASSDQTKPMADS
ncbi:MAG TPA: MarR family winged helix-turn-helix transcriptional regulator [Gemmatimonas sp.]|nr:MarR family winged helix-turn-helix transcriptional regulator [Gemmatimonas sp.]